MERISSENSGMASSQTSSARHGTSTSSFLTCRRNIVDIMEQGQQLRCELQSIRHEFLGLINGNDNISHQPLSKQKACKTPNAQILNLLRSASEKLQRSQVAPTSPTFGAKSFGTQDECQTPTRFGLRGAQNPTARKFFDSPVLEKATDWKSTDLRVAVTKRKQFFSSPVLSKVPRLDSCLSCDNLLSEDNEDIVNVATPKRRKSSRRSSLHKFLSPMRRRSASLEKGKSSAAKPPQKSRLSIITNGLLFNRNQVDAVDDVPKKSANLPQIKTVFTSRGMRMPADGSDSSDMTPSSTIYGVNDTGKTAELSSDVYSTTPTSTLNPAPTPSRLTNQSTATHEHSPVTDVIRKVTCNFVTPIEESQQCAPVMASNRKSTRGMNRINASELMTSLDDDSFAISDAVGKCVAGETTVTDKNIANISTISAANTVNITLREQASVCDLTAGNVLHSTFNYPLHSTMYNPLQCTIANMQKSLDADSIELSGDELDFSATNNTSDCDSSALSIDVDTTTIAAEETDGNCNVCKVTQLRREMAQPHLESRRRRAPVGLSQTDIELEWKLPKERPAPIGASQSVLDADQTLVNANQWPDETFSATIGSAPNLTALTELDSTLKERSAAKRNRVRANGGKRQRRNSEKDSSAKKSKSHRKSSRKNIHDKENQFDPEDFAKRSSHLETPNSSSYLSTSQKRELKRKFRSFNSTLNSSHQTTLAFF